MGCNVLRRPSRRDNVAGYRCLVDETDEVIAGDLTAALAYLTPAGGAVATGVAPVGLRDRERGDHDVTTSLGLPRKLERMLGTAGRARVPRRSHGFSSSPRYVLLQGDVAGVARAGPRVADGGAATRGGAVPRRGEAQVRSGTAGCASTTSSASLWRSRHGASRLGPISPARARPRRTARRRGRLPAPQQAPGGGVGPRIDAKQAAGAAGAVPSPARLSGRQRLPGHQRRSSWRRAARGLRDPCGQPACFRSAAGARACSPTTTARSSCRSRCVS